MPVTGERVWNLNLVPAAPFRELLMNELGFFQNFRSYLTEDTSVLSKGLRRKEFPGSPSLGIMLTKNGSGNSNQPNSGS